MNQPLLWAGWAVPAIFAIAYLLALCEERLRLHKSKPMVLAAGLIWAILAIAYKRLGRTEELDAALSHVLLDYAELLIFLLVAMTYVNALEERHIFAVLRARLVRAGLSYRALFWITGALAFVISPVADNLTTALVLGAVVVALGRDEPKFVTLSCVNIVVAANAGGAFSPFGDLTTLMVWQKGVVAFGDFFRLFLPSLVNFVVPALLMHFAVPKGAPPPRQETATLRPGARRIVVLFALTVTTAILLHTYMHLPPALGMMTGLGYLQMFDYHLELRGRRRGAETDYTFEVFRRIASVEWDTLLFFYGVMMCVGGLALLGYLAVASQALYGGLGATPANILIGIVSALLDNIPLMYAVLTMQPDMPLGQWLLITLTAGVGGSLLSIGSAAGVALMGQARGVYTFSTHLRWSWAVAAGYAASIAVHLLINRATF